MPPDVEALRLRIPSLASAVSCSPMPGGCSTDGKYRVRFASGGDAVLRVATPAEGARRDAHMRALRRLRQCGLSVPAPIDSGTVEDLGLVYTVETYVEGEPADAVLPTLPRASQYAVGMEAGGDLFRMHRVPGPAAPPWYRRIVEKHRRYVEAYRTCGVEIDGGARICAFVETHAGALRGRPCRFQHGDFHVGNMVVNDGRYAGAVDFECHDWGDPHEEFRKLGFFSRRVSVPFCLGQVAGYFGDDGPPDGFWRLHAVYMAMNAIWTLVWALRAVPDDMDDTLAIIARVVDDHQGFESFVPRWYAAGAGAE